MKCYLCNKEKQTKEIYNKHICNDCMKEVNKYAKLINKAIKTK